eukprot:4451749-Amphidinium_carterae.1
MVNSIAQFELRLAALDLDRHKTNLTTRGMTTIGSMAACCAYIPGVSQTDDELVHKLVEPILDDPEHRDAPKLKQLFIECYTINAMVMKNQLAGQDEHK